MEHRDEWRDVFLQERIDQALVVIQPFGVDRAFALRQHPAPGDGEAVGVHLHLGHNVDVGLKIVIGVAGHVAGVAVFDFARLADENVPGGRPFAVGVPAAFDLVGGGRGAKVEVLGKLGEGASLLYPFVLAERAVSSAISDQVRRASISGLQLQCDGVVPKSRRVPALSPDRWGRIASV